MPFEYTWVDLLIRQHVLLNVLHTISFGETQYAPLSASVNHSHPNPLAWSQYFIPLSRRVQHFKPVFKPSTFHTHQLLSALLSRSLPREIVPLLILSLLTCIYFLFYTLFFFHNKFHDVFEVCCGQLLSSVTEANVQMFCCAGIPV